MGHTKFLVKKYLVKKVFAQKKKFCSRKYFGKEKILVQNVLGFCQKLGRVNPGGGFMTPPQKIVGLKLCGIVVSCLKRKFLLQ